MLAEFMDWSKCLISGLQSKKAFTMVYESFADANKRRNEFVIRRITETLKENELGILLIREGTPVQFPQDIQVFYVAPPALDEIKRWLRDSETKSQE